MNARARIIDINFILSPCFFMIFKLWSLRIIVKGINF